MRLFGIFLLAVLASACGEPDTGPVEAPVRPAKLVVVERSSEVKTLRLPLVVGAAETSVLTFQVAGVLQRLNVFEGDEVSEGDVLAQLDQRDFRNDLSAAQAQFDTAEAEFQRAASLLAEDAIARSTFEQRRSARDVAQATLDSAQKRLEDTTIRAPFDGVVAVIHVESFESVPPQQPIMTLQSDSTAEAVVQMPASIVVNAEQIVPLQLYAELDAAPGVRMNAILAETAAIADPTTQTFEVRFGFSPPDTLLVLPGMTGILHGQFRLATETEDDRIVIPLNAVVASAGAPYVWVVDEPTMSVSKRPVVVRPGIGESVVVDPLIRDDNGETVSGVEAGEVLVSAGGHYLSEGVQVRPYAP